MQQVLGLEESGNLGSFFQSHLWLPAPQLWGKALICLGGLTGLLPCLVQGKSLMLCLGLSLPSSLSQGQVEKDNQSPSYSGYR